MIWNSQAEAFTETETPLVYNPQLGAYVETTGRIWNPVPGAWQDVWPVHPKVLYLYNEGDECTRASGGWVSGGFRYHSSAFIPYAPRITKNADHIYIDGLPAANRTGVVYTADRIDLAPYTKLSCIASASEPYASSVHIMFGIYDDFDRYYNHDLPEGTIAFSAGNGSGNTVADRKLIELDISGTTGSYYVGIWVGASANKTIDYAKLHRCWME